MRAPPFLFQTPGFRSRTLPATIWYRCYQTRLGEKQRIVDDLDAGFAMEMHAYLCDKPEHRDRVGEEAVEKMEGFTEADRKKGIREQVTT